MNGTFQLDRRSKVKIIIQKGVLGILAFISGALIVNFAYTPEPRLAIEILGAYVGFAASCIGVLTCNIILSDSCNDS